MQKQTTLANNYFKSFLTRLGKIFSNISIFSLILCLCGFLSFVSIIFIFLIGAIAIIFTLGFIFMIAPNFMDSLGNAIKISASLSQFFLNNLYIFASITIICSIISLILLLVDKRQKHTARVILSILVIAVATLIIVVFALGVISWIQ